MREQQQQQKNAFSMKIKREQLRKKGDEDGLCVRSEEITRKTGFEPTERKY